MFGGTINQNLKLVRCSQKQQLCHYCTLRFIHDLGHQLGQGHCNTILNEPFVLYLYDLKNEVLLYRSTIQLKYLTNIHQPLLCGGQRNPRLTALDYPNNICQSTFEILYNISFHTHMLEDLYKHHLFSNWRIRLKKQYHQSEQYFSQQFINPERVYVPKLKKFIIDLFNTSSKQLLVCLTLLIIKLNKLIIACMDLFNTSSNSQLFYCYLQSV